MIDLQRTSLSTRSSTGATSTALTELGILFASRESMDDFKAESVFDMSSSFEGTEEKSSLTKAKSLLLLSTVLIFSVSISSRASLTKLLLASSLLTYHHLCLQP